MLTLVYPLNTIQMKNTLTWAACAAAFALASCGAPAETKTDAAPEKVAAPVSKELNLTDGSYTVDPAASTVSWKGTKITNDSHVGTVNVYKGTINVYDNALGKTFVSIDMNTMVCTDEGMDEDTKGNLIGHLKSDDFFGVEQFPYAQILLNEFIADGSNGLAYGEIRIRDIAQPVKFPYTISSENGTITVDASLTVDRSKHEVKFRSGAFPDLFPDLGDKLINDDIELDVHIVATL